MLLEILQQAVLSLGISVYLVGLFYPSLVRIQSSLNQTAAGVPVLTPLTRVTPQEILVAIREASFGWKDVILLSDVTLEVQLFDRFDISIRPNQMPA
jgi:hypothetical protein